MAVTVNRVRTRVAGVVAALLLLTLALCTARVGAQIPSCVFDPDEDCPPDLAQPTPPVPTPTLAFNDDDARRAYVPPFCAAAGRASPPLARVNASAPPRAVLGVKSTANNVFSDGELQAFRLFVDWANERDGGVRIGGVTHRLQLREFAVRAPVPGEPTPSVASGPPPCVLTNSCDDDLTQPTPASGKRQTTTTCNASATVKFVASLVTDDGDALPVRDGVVACTSTCSEPSDSVVVGTSSASRGKTTLTLARGLVSCTVDLSSASVVLGAGDAARTIDAAQPPALTSQLLVAEAGARVKYTFDVRTSLSADDDDDDATTTTTPSTTTTTTTPPPSLDGDYVRLEFDSADEAEVALACDREVTINMLSGVGALEPTTDGVKQTKVSMGTRFNVLSTGVEERMLSIIAPVDVGFAAPLRQLALAGGRHLGIVYDAIVGADCAKVADPLQSNGYGFRTVSAWQHSALAERFVGALDGDNADLIRNATATIDCALQSASAFPSIDAELDAQCAPSHRTEFAPPSAVSETLREFRDTRTRAGDPIDVLIYCGNWNWGAAHLSETLRNAGDAMYFPVVALLGTARFYDTATGEPLDKDRPPLPAFWSTIEMWAPGANVNFRDAAFVDRENYTTAGDEWTAMFDARWGDVRDAAGIARLPDTFEAGQFNAARLAAEALTKLTSLDEVRGALDGSAQRALQQTVLVSSLQTFIGRVAFDSDGTGQVQQLLYQNSDPDVVEVALAGDEAERDEMLRAYTEDERRARFSHSGERTQANYRAIGNGENLGARPVSPLEAASSSLIFPMPTYAERVFTGGWWSQASEVAIGVVTIVVMVSVLAIGVATLVLRKHRVLLASSLLFNTLFLVGALLALSTNYVWMLYTDDAACQARPWLLGLGLSLMFGALLCKSWRVYRLFRALKNVTVERETGLYVLAASIVACELLFLAIWTGVAPLRAVFRVPDALRPSTAYYECDGDDLVAWSAVQVALLGVILVVNVALTFLIRHVKLVCFNESRYIIFSVYNMLTLGIILVALQYSQAVDREPLFILRSVLVLFAVGMSVWVLFVSKFWLIYKKVELTASGTSKSSGSSHGSTPSASPMSALSSSRVIAPSSSTATDQRAMSAESSTSASSVR